MTHCRTRIRNPNRIRRVLLGYKLLPARITGMTNSKPLPLSSLVFLFALLLLDLLRPTVHVGLEAAQQK
jgi:hypothetical protein